MGATIIHANSLYVITEGEQAGPLPPSPQVKTRRFRIKAMRVKVRTLPSGGQEVGQIGFGAVVEALEVTPGWWGRIENPKAGWIDLSLCEEIT